MRIVVADTGPLQYLILIGHIDILPRLFESITIPRVVQKEMLHPAAPQAVRIWAEAPPSWLAVAPDVPESDATLQKLGAGEHAAIMLALVIKADLVLMDDRAGVAAARAKGLSTTGTLGVIDLAARSGLVNLEAAFEQLKATNFRRPPQYSKQCSPFGEKMGRVNNLVSIPQVDAVVVSVSTAAHLVPALVAARGEAASWRYVEFFTANIRNPNTRRAYARATARFFAWCEDRALTLLAIRPHDVATYIEGLQQTHSTPGVKQQLAAVRMLFDWLITGQVVPINPAAAVRGPKYVVKIGKTPVLESAEWRRLVDAIPTETVRNLRDRALIATLTYSFARIGAALKMRVEDLRPRGSGWTVRLHEKGGKEHAMPCHHALAEALHAYIAVAGIAEDRKGWLFRTSQGHAGVALSGRAMGQPDAWRMIRRRAAVAGITAPIGNHTFRATGITAYLGNGGALEHAQEMAAHESPRTTKLYDRTKERLTQDEVERIRL